MKHLVVLTSTDAKKFIAKSLVQKSEKFLRSLEKGKIVLHPSTSTVFVYEEIMGSKPEGLWVCGVVTGKGTCISKEFEELAAERKNTFDQHDVKYSWYFSRGQFIKGVPLEDCLKEMKSGDLYVKGINVIDRKGSAGVLTANKDGGTITRVMSHAKQNNFEIILVATANKFVNVILEEVVKITGSDALDGSMGIPVGIYKVNGSLITEIEAFRLQGVRAIPIASGGLFEADGAGVFVIEGSKKDINVCLNVIEQCKGSKLEIAFPECQQCRYDKCPRSLCHA